MEEILNLPDSVPQDLLNKAECVIVIPSMTKVAIGFGGSYDRGAMVCRSGASFDGAWGSPAMYAIEGGSFGLQLGAQSTDLVLLVMNTRGVEALLSTKVQLGANMSAAAGPKGRDTGASKDASLRAEMLSYSRSRGLFAGVSLEETSLRPDDDASAEIYGHKVTARRDRARNEERRSRRRPSSCRRAPEKSCPQRVDCGAIVAPSISVGVPHGIAATTALRLSLTQRAAYAPIVVCEAVLRSPR